MDPLRRNVSILAPEPGFTSGSARGFSALILKEKQRDWQDNEWALPPFFIQTSYVKFHVKLSLWAQRPVRNGWNIHNNIKVTN